MGLKKDLFIHICRTALKNFVPLGELADDVLFGTLDVIQENEREQLIQKMEGQIEALSSKIGTVHPEQLSQYIQEHQEIQQEIQTLSQVYQADFRQFFDRLKLLESKVELHESKIAVHDSKIITMSQDLLKIKEEIAKQQQGGDQEDEVKLANNFPRLTSDILQKLSSKGDIRNYYEELKKEEVLGSGGMGKIYKTRRKSSQKTVALKLYHQSGMFEPRSITRFLIEGYVGCQLRSERIRGIYDFGGFVDSRQFFIECEYVDGEEIGSWWEKIGPDDKKQLQLMMQTLEGLKYLQSQHLVHRDIKPENLFVTKEGNIKIIDLGIVKVLDRKISATITKQTVGTPKYMAPEQIDPKNFGSISEKTDVYSFGVTFFELFTGRALFVDRQGRDLEGRELDDAILKKNPDDLRKLNPQIPEELASIISACLRKKQDGRPSVPQLMEDIEDCQRKIFQSSQAISHDESEIQKLAEMGFSSDSRIYEKLNSLEKNILDRLSPQVKEHLKDEKIQDARRASLAKIQRQKQNTALDLRRFRIDFKSQGCPNLFCHAGHAAGKKSCPVCETAFTLICPKCKNSHNYFSDTCNCGKKLSKGDKFLAVIRHTSLHCQRNDIPEQGMIGILSFLDLVKVEKTPEIEKILAEQQRLQKKKNQNFEEGVLSEFRVEIEQIAEESKGLWDRNYNQTSEEYLQKVKAFIDEERYLEALPYIDRIPEQYKSSQIQHRENHIYITLISINIGAVKKGIEKYIGQRRYEDAIGIIDSISDRIGKDDEIKTLENKIYEIVLLRDIELFKKGIEKFIEEKRYTEALALLSKANQEEPAILFFQNQIHELIEENKLKEAENLIQEDGLSKAFYLLKNLTYPSAKQVDLLRDCTDRAREKESWKGLAVLALLYSIFFAFFTPVFTPWMAGGSLLLFITMGIEPPEGEFSISNICLGLAWGGFLFWEIFYFSPMPIISLRMVVFFLFGIVLVLAFKREELDVLPGGIFFLKIILIGLGVGLLLYIGSLEFLLALILAFIKLILVLALGALKTTFIFAAFGGFIGALFGEGAGALVGAVLGAIIGIIYYFSSLASSTFGKDFSFLMENFRSITSGVIDTSSFVIVPILGVFIYTYCVQKADLSIQWKARLIGLAVLLLASLSLLAL